MSLEYIGNVHFTESVKVTCGWSHEYSCRYLSDIFNFTVFYDLRYITVTLTLIYDDLQA